MNEQDKILIVEDELTLLDLLKSIFEANGLNVLTAKDGIDAVEVFTAHKDEIKVVLSDLGLPRLGGWDAFLKMKAMKPEVKGILASGYYSMDMKSDILKSGADNFIQKPYDPPGLIDMIRGMLEEGA